MMHMTVETDSMCYEEHSLMAVPHQPHDQDTRMHAVRHYRPIEALVPTHWQSATIIANGIHVQYSRTGGQKPPLLLLHGFAEHGLCWLRVARALEHDYDIIMPDVRGHGRSAAATGDVALDTLAADQAALIRVLGLERPAVLGRSMGAAIAVQLAATFPDRVRAVLLEDPPMRPMPVPDPDTNPGYAAWYQSWLDQMQTLKTLPHADRLQAALALQPGAELWVEDDLVTWVAAQVQFDLETIAPALAHPGLFGGWQQAVAQMTCPILLMTGDPQRGSVSTTEGIQAVLAAWHSGEHMVFRNAGHLISREACEPYVAAVAQFLRQVAQ
jgi:pimeloyl-ACP methyl ester carboxylesterase